MTDAAPIAPVQDHLLSNKQYNALKRGVQVVLPAGGALYAGLATLWGLPNGTEVVGTIALLSTFGGVVLGIGEKSYDNSDSKYDGVINVAQDENGLKHADIVLKNYENPADVVNQDQALFKITNAPKA